MATLLRRGHHYTRWDISSSVALLVAGAVIAIIAIMAIVRPWATM